MAKLDVRGGLFVDALRLHCAPGEAADGDAAAAAAAAAADAAPPERISPWFGGEGGDECPLTCEAGVGSYRSGGLVEGLVASGGERIDRLEMHKCTGDLDV